MPGTSSNSARTLSIVMGLEQYINRVPCARARRSCQSNSVCTATVFVAVRVDWGLPCERTGLLVDVGLRGDATSSGPLAFSNLALQIIELPFRHTTSDSYLLLKVHEGYPQGNKNHNGLSVLEDILNCHSPLFLLPETWRKSESRHNWLQLALVRCIFAYQVVLPNTRILGCATVRTHLKLERRREYSQNSQLPRFICESMLLSLFSR